MSIHCNLWVDSLGDRLSVRDFFFDAAQCDYYLKGPQEEIVYGRPDRETRDFYDMGNGHNMVAVNTRPLHGLAVERVRVDTRVGFTLNAKSKAEQWLEECLFAAVSWLANGQGDAHFVAMQMPLLERRSEDLVLNTDAHAFLAKNYLGQNAASEMASSLSRVLEAANLRVELASIPFD